MISELIAGDHYDIDLSFPDYPATGGYAVKLYLRGQGLLQVNAVANGDDYTVTLTSAQTQLLPAGQYQYAIMATLNDQRTTIEAGYVTVLPDVATTNSSVVELEKRVRVIECVLSDKIESDMLDYSIAGRSVTVIPIDDLLRLRAMAVRELSELTGNAAPRTIKVRFTGLR